VTTRSNIYRKLFTTRKNVISIWLAFLPFNKSHISSRGSLIVITTDATLYLYNILSHQVILQSDNNPKRVQTYSGLSVLSAWWTISKCLLGRHRPESFSVKNHTHQRCRCKLWKSALRLRFPAIVRNNRACCCMVHGEDTRAMVCGDARSNNLSCWHATNGVKLSLWFLFSTRLLAVYLPECCVRVNISDRLRVPGSGIAATTCWSLYITPNGLCSGIGCCGSGQRRQKK
jgi:hypothetical protein